MADSSNIEQRIAQLKQLLKKKKQEEKEREVSKILRMAKTSGLSLLDIENMIIQKQEKAGGNE